LKRAWLIEYMGCWDAGEAAVRVGVERCDGWLLRGSKDVVRVLRRIQEMAAGEKVIGLGEAMEILTGMVRTGVSDFLKEGDGGAVSLDLEKVRKEGKYLEEVSVDEIEKRDKDGNVVGVVRKGKIKVGRREALAMLGRMRGWDLRGARELEKGERAAARESAVHGVKELDGAGSGDGGGSGFRLTMNFGAPKEIEGEAEKVDIPPPVMLPSRRAVGGVLEIDVSNDAVRVGNKATTDVVVGSGSLAPLRMIERDGRVVR